MSKTLYDFYHDLGIRESSGNYNIINKWGYVGKYQMGEAALIDAGYYIKKPDNPVYQTYNRDWTGNWTGKDGINSLNDFLKNYQVQEKAQRIFKQKQWKQLKNIGADKYVNQIINGIKITPSGLLAGAHLKGPGNVIKYLKSGGKFNPDDKLGTTVEDYIKKFAGYDVSDITGKKDSVKPTGGAASIKEFTREQVNSMSNKEYETNKSPQK